MVKNKNLPKLIKNKKNGKRYILFNKKRYVISGNASDRYIIKNFFDIIKELIKQRKRRRSGTMKKNEKLKITPTMTGSSAADFAKIHSYEETNKIRSIISNFDKNVKEINKKIEDKKKKIQLLKENGEQNEEEIKEVNHEPDDRTRQQKMTEIIKTQQETIDNYNKEIKNIEKIRIDVEQTFKIRNDELERAMETKNTDYQDLLNKVSSTENQLQEINNLLTKASHDKRKLEVEKDKVQEELQLLSIENFNANITKKAINEIITTYNLPVTKVSVKGQSKDNAIEEIENDVNSPAAQYLFELKSNSKYTANKKILENKILDDMKYFQKNNNLPEPKIDNLPDPEYDNLIEPEINNIIMPPEDVPIPTPLVLINDDQLKDLKHLEELEKMEQLQNDLIESEKKTLSKYKTLKPQFDVDTKSVSKKMDMLSELTNSAKKNIKNREDINEKVEKMRAAKKKDLKEEEKAKFDADIVNKAADRRRALVGSDSENEDNDSEDENFDWGITDDDVIKGTGNTKKIGLYNYEINALMKKYHKKGFAGVYSIDKLNQIKVNTLKPTISFIMNIMPSNVNIGHWVAIYITKKNLEYYDSFGNLPPELFIKNIKPIIQKWVGDKALQFKINRIKIQSVNSDNCGYYAMHFLINRYNGKTFKEITKYNKLTGVLKSEKQIKVFKKKMKLPEFNYIQANS
jgi:hypothetical protein